MQPLSRRVLGSLAVHYHAVIPLEPPRALPDVQRRYVSAELCARQFHRATRDARRGRVRLELVLAADRLPVR